MTLERSLPLETLLAEADHVTALARALVTDPATAEDVAQSTWLDVLRSEQRSIVDPRAWLATIVRRRALRARRTEARRSHRERIAADAKAGATAPSAAELAARVATHREVVDAVLALDEPYRETIVLRFFENLDVDAIALRMQTKRNTVRSRLQRGLEALRERLDRAYGGREHWLPAVAALASRQTALELTAASSVITGGIAFAITMKKLAFVLTALVVVALFTLPMLTPPAASIPPNANDAPTIANAAVVPAETKDARPDASTGGSSATANTASERARVVVAAPSEPAPVRRRVVDRDGKPLEEVLVRAAAATTVRWQGGDRGWIGGAGHTIRILADEEQRILNDRRYQDVFFAKLPTPDEWRATILGTPIPAREVRSDRDGWFTFPRTLGVDDDAVEIADPRYVLVTAGEGSTKPWVVGPSVRIEGSVHDDDGKPITEAFAMAVCPTDKEPFDLQGQLATRSDDSGAFLVRRALANGAVRVWCDGYREAIVPLTQDVVQRPYVVLHRPGFTSMRTITGTVSASGGAPIGNASVWFGRQQTKTAADGRFTLAADDAKPSYALTIIAKGFAALQENDFGKKVLAGGPTQNLLFVLEKRPKRIRGIVRHHDGSPAIGAMVFLIDPTLLDVTFDTVESRVGETTTVIRADANGAFTIEGLDDRLYRVRAVDPTNAASDTSQPWRPGERELVLRLGDGNTIEFSGRVVDADRKPLAKATVEIAFFTHVTKGGGTHMESTSAVPCKTNGDFTIPLCWENHDAWLCVRVDGKVRQMIPVQQFDTLTVCDGTRWLRLLNDSSRSIKTMHFVLAGGSLVDAGKRHNWWPDRATPIPKGAVAVILDQEDKDMLRLELTDDYAVHLRVP